MVILDTDLLTLFQQGRGATAIQLRSRLSLLADGDVCTTIVTYEEQMRGWLAAMSAARDVARQVQVYNRLMQHLAYFNDIRTLPFDELAAVEFQRLRKAKIRIGTMDLKIASIALTARATLLSRNLSDFRQVPGLAVEDWSA